MDVVFLAFVSFLKSLSNSVLKKVIIIIYTFIIADFPAKIYQTNLPFSIFTFLFPLAEDKAFACFYLILDK